MYLNNAASKSTGCLLYIHIQCLFYGHTIGIPTSYISENSKVQNRYILQYAVIQKLHNSYLLTIYGHMVVTV